MPSEIKKVKIKELPQAESIHDDDIFIESDTVKTYKASACDIAAYVSQNENLKSKYVSKDSIGRADGVAPLNSSRKISGDYITYGTASNTAYEGSRGKILEQNLESHLSDTDAHGYSTEINKEISRASAAEEALENTINANKPVWDDKYTRNEIDNKFSELETAVDWKEAVDTFADIASAYPDPEDGWTVNVKDTDYTYRYSGSRWVVISANAIPKATKSVDGLLTKEDKTNYDDAVSKKHTHNNKSVLDTITQDMVDKLDGVPDGGLENIKPEDIGALPVSGGMMEGDIEWNNAYGKFILRASSTELDILFQRGTSTLENVLKMVPRSNHVGGVNVTLYGDADTVDGKHASDLQNYNNLTNKPTIPTIPSSLPANGGNADTVDGKHASDLLPLSGGEMNENATIRFKGHAISTGLDLVSDDNKYTTYITPAETRVPKLFVGEGFGSRELRNHVSDTAVNDSSISMGDIGITYLDTGGAVILSISGFFDTKVAKAIITVENENVNSKTCNEYENTYFMVFDAINKEIEMGAIRLTTSGYELHLNNLSERALYIFGTIILERAK